MLAINREPLHKNKLLLSSLAVFAGFLLTVGTIRTFVTSDTSTQQSAQSGDERRAPSLIPINASESEAGSESGEASPQPDVARTAAPSEQQLTLSPMKNSAGTATQSPVSSSNSSNMTPSAPSTSGGVNEPSNPPAEPPAPEQDPPSTGGSGEACLDLLGQPLICL